VSFFEWISSWANVPFAIAGLATLLFGAVQASGLLGLLAGGGDAEGDADSDGDADVEADVHAEAEGDVDADGEGEDAEGESSSTDASLPGMVLAPLAIGRVPVTLTAQTFAMTFAVVGLCLNAMWTHAASVPLFTLGWTLPAAGLLGYGAAALVAKIALPIVDDRRHAATTRNELVGAIGVVISSRVTGEFGEVRVRDKSGHDVRMVVKLAPRSRDLEEREEAVIVDVDERGTPRVTALD
jgi:hypothetical protein